MTIRRVITDIAPTDVPFVLAMIAADGGTVVRQDPEPDGEVTIVAEFPDHPTATATAASAEAASSAAAIAARAAADAAWMSVARGEMRSADSAGEEGRPRVAAYDATTHGGPDTDAVPWCSSFVNFCISRTGLTGTQSRMARSWMTWGRDAGAFVPGCIVVLQRGSAPRAHVGFCVEGHGGVVKVLGGNQADEVNVAAFDSSRVLARRLPS